MPSQSYGSYRRDRKREKRLQNLMVLLQGLKALGGGLGSYFKTKAYKDAKATEAAQEGARESRLTAESDIRKRKMLAEIEKLTKQSEGTWPGDLDPLSDKERGYFTSRVQANPDASLDEILSLSPTKPTGPFGSSIQEMEEFDLYGQEKGLHYPLMDPRRRPELEKLFQELRPPAQPPTPEQEEMAAPYKALMEKAMNPFGSGDKGGPMSMVSPQGEMETPKDRSMLAEFGALYRSAMNENDPANVLALARLNRLFNVPLPMDVQAQAQGLGGPMLQGLGGLSV